MLENRPSGFKCLSRVQFQLFTLTQGMPIHEGKDQVDQHEPDSVDGEKHRVILGSNAIRRGLDLKKLIEEHAEQKFERVDVRDDYEQQQSVKAASCNVFEPKSAKV